MTNGSRLEILQNAPILQYFDLHKAIIGIENQFSVFFLSGHLRQVLLYHTS